MSSSDLLRDAYAGLPDTLATSDLWQGGNGGFTATMDHVVDGADLVHHLVFEDGALQIPAVVDESDVTFRVHGPDETWLTLLSGAADPMDMLVHGELVVDATTVDLVEHMQPFCLLFLIMAQLRIGSRTT